MVAVVPSLPAQSFQEIEVLADALEGTSRELQIDIVDGQFVDARAWPFTELRPYEALRQLTQLHDRFELEIDCMILRPERYLDLFHELGVARVIVHVGSTDEYDAIVLHAHTHGYKIGIAFTNDVSPESYEALIPEVDFVQVMGIAEVGKQGQPFDDRTLATLRTLRAAYPALEIAVDGSVNEDTIRALVDAGATRLAPGSAVAKQTDPKAAYHHLVSLVS